MPCTARNETAWFKYTAFQVPIIATKSIKQLAQLIWSYNARSRSSPCWPIAIIARASLKLSLLCSIPDEPLLPRLAELSPEAARAAIVEPVKRLGIAYASGLPEMIVAALLDNEGFINPFQLQLVCASLYEAKDGNQDIIDPQLYNQLGGAVAVLRNYVGQSIAGLPSDVKRATDWLLAQLVSPQGSHHTHSVVELQSEWDLSLELLLAAVANLVQARILRQTREEDGGQYVELFHDYLVNTTLLYFGNYYQRGAI